MTDERRRRRLFYGRCTMTAQREVLNVRGLSAGYGPMRVIHDLDLIVNSGERVGIVGLNGHGKSTLFYAIAGLTGWQRGSIKLKGIEVGRTRSQGPGRYTHQVVRAGLALIPQGDEIFHGLTVEEHLDFRRLHGAGLARAGATQTGNSRNIPAVETTVAYSCGSPIGWGTTYGRDRPRSDGRGVVVSCR